MKYNFIVFLTLVLVSRFSFAVGACNVAVPPFNFTDPVLTSGVTPIKAVHINDLRTALNAKRAACGSPATIWAEPIVLGVTTIKKTQIDELRVSVNALITQVAVARAQAVVLPNFTDPALRAGVTPIKTSHIQELRAAINNVNCGGSPTWNITLDLTENSMPTKHNAWLVALLNAVKIPEAYACVGVIDVCAGLDDGSAEILPGVCVGVRAGHGGGVCPGDPQVLNAYHWIGKPCLPTEIGNVQRVCGQNQCTGAVVVSHQVTCGCT